MKSLSILVLFALSLSGGRFAAHAGVLAGEVRDAQTGAPLPGASVVVAELNSGAETDSLGLFEVAPVPAGVYTVRASHVGYHPVSEEGVRVFEAGRVSLRFRLTPGVIRLEGIEVVAEPVGAADIHRRPSFVTVVRREAFEGRMTSVPEVLSSTTGVQVKRLGGLGSFSTLSIRGSSAEQVEVYLDGILLNSALGGGVNLSNLPLAQVAQIEIYRGAATQGEGMGGTVHIRTRASDRELRLGGSGSWGSFDSRGLNAMVSDRRGHTACLLLADYSASDNDFRFLDDNGTEYNPDDDAFTARQNSDFSSGSILGKWEHRFVRGWRVYAQENLYWKHQGIPGISNNQSHDARLNTFRSMTEVGIRIPNWLGRFSVGQGLFFTHKGEAFHDPRGEVGVGYQDNRYRTRSYGWQGRLQAVLGGEHTVTVGMSVRRETFLPEDRLGKRPRLLESSRWTASGRAGADWMLPGGRGILSMSVDIRHQRSRMFAENPYPYSPLAPDTTTGRTLASIRSGVRFNLTPNLLLKANFGRSHRAPSFFELFGDRGGVIGNTSLVPEKGMTWDAGVRFQQREGDAAIAEAVYFDHRYRNLIQFVQTSQSVSMPHNIGRARVRGVEVTASGTWFDRWTMSGNYTYQRALDESRIPYRRGNILPNRPTQELHVHTGIQLGRWAVFYDYTFEGGNFLDRANLRPIPTRHIHNAGVRLTLFRHTRITIEARNLRNTQVADLWGYPLPGRSYFVTVQENF